MTVATTSGGQPGGGALERGGGTLADVVETVLDKGVVIDAQISIAVVGIQLVEINARIVIASVETYLKFAEAANRLSITPEGAKGLPDLVGDGAKAVGKGKAASGLGQAAKDISGAVVESLSGKDSDDEGEDDEKPRRRREKER
jgi:gas vesicle structural protein